MSQVLEGTLEGTDAIEVESPPQASPREASARQTSRVRAVAAWRRLRQSALFRWALRAVLLIAGIGIIYTVIPAGLSLREQIWQRTAAVRFLGDINNGFHWGNRVLRLARQHAGLDPRSSAAVTWRQFFVGYLHTYDHVEERSRDDNYGLDYTPLRLLIMSAWVKHVRDAHPTGGWRDEFTVPLLKLNTACELAAAVGMFLVVFHWLRRSGRPVELSAALALLAGCVLWFNPSNLLNAHAWPQWDVWIVPFLLWAIFLVSVEWWFAAGVLVGLGALLKGQILLTAPVLVLWPLFQGRVGPACRIVLGGLTGVACTTGVWLAPSWQAAAWLGCVVGSSLVSWLLMRQWKPSRRWGIAALLLLLALAWPWMRAGLWRWIWIAPALTSLLLLVPRVLPKRAWPFATVGAALLGLVIASAAFEGSWSWLAVGYGYPTRHYEQMTMGPTSNLPALLARKPYGWKLYDVVPLTLPWVGQITPSMRTVLASVYGLTLVLCGIGAAVHHRRNDPRLLVALIAPWVLMFALLAQMHERYLMWAAALGGMAVAVSLGTSLLHLLVMGVSLIMMTHQVLGRDRKFAPEVMKFVEWTYPNIGWAVLVLAMVYLYLAVMPGRRPTIRTPA